MSVIKRHVQTALDFDLLLPADASKDVHSRMMFFLHWLAEKGYSWDRPTLSDYRDYLLSPAREIINHKGELVSAPLSPTSASAHLSTVRGRYRALLNSNRVRDILFESLPADVQSPADRKALVDEVLTRLTHEIHPMHSAVPLIKVQDTPDSAHLRLTPAQVKALLRAPGTDNLRGLRDTALIALLACTGIREMELTALNVDDLRQSLGGEPALLVRSGKDRQQRMIPYGVLGWCLDYVERWLQAAEITTGAVFRGIFKGDKRIRKTGMTTHAINQTLHRYPIMANGRLTTVNPHDLRRTYAYNAYLQGMDILRIQQNLGHSSPETTLIYIGQFDGAQRRPPEMFAPPYPTPEAVAAPARKRKR